jgi:hypothetical protein
VAALLITAEEHVARLKAEAEAQDCANRLRVAQEQLAEYAAQKEGDSVGVVQVRLTFQVLVAGIRPPVPGVHANMLIVLDIHMGHM